MNADFILATLQAAESRLMTIDAMKNPTIPLNDDVLERLRKAQELSAQRARECVWRTDYIAETGYIDRTACGMEPARIHRANGPFCPFCGGKIVAASPPEQPR